MSPYPTQRSGGSQTGVTRTAPAVVRWKRVPVSVGRDHARHYCPACGQKLRACQCARTR